MIKHYPILVIPALNPDEKLLKLLQAHKLLASEQKCIIVNDGSRVDSIPIFTRLEEEGYIVLHHAKNIGKGGALKTAIAYYLKYFAEDSPGIVTADADGQHSMGDIAKLTEAFLNEPKKMHLGVRQLSRNNVPFRSKMGNSLTKNIFNFLTNSKVTDTQTGLRGIPLDLVRHLITSSKTHYDFEFEMFFIAKRLDLQIRQIPIETIYLDNNKDSYFNPIIDSLRIYFVFLRFCSVGIFSFLLDFTLFSIFYFYSMKPALAVFAARSISAPTNFILNKRVSFKSGNGLILSGIQYFALVVLAGLSSFSVMNIIQRTGVPIYYSKIIAECLIFLLNFLIQYWIIFPNNRKMKPLIKTSANK